MTARQPLSHPMPSFHLLTAQNFNLQKSEVMFHKVRPIPLPGNLARGFVGAIPASSPYLQPLLRGAGSPVRPYHSTPFQYMEFRKTMDIDHILIGSPPR